MSGARHGLGKGLDALLPETEERTELAIADIKPQAGQPRRRFPEKELMELAYSIRMHGLLQPLVVTPAAEGFTLIAGERRLRASKLAGLSHVLVYVRDAETHQHFELALIENLQRADLNPVEAARAYAKLMAESSLTQEDLAKRLGKSRPAIANSLRLLDLPDRILQALENGQLTPGHANALLARNGEAQNELFTAIVEQKLSVRQAEAWGGKPGASKRTAPAQPDWVTDLGRTLGTQVERRGSDQKGRLILHYHSATALNELLERLND